MSEEVYANDGRVHIMIADGYEREHEVCTPAEARDYAAQIIAAADECDAQAETIRAACADGHQWGSGMNCYRDWQTRDPVTVRYCDRLGCDGREELDGWAHFAGRLHVEPYTGRQLDCYGPGCENCDTAAAGIALRQMLAKASVRLVTAIDTGREL